MSDEMFRRDGIWFVVEGYLIDTSGVAYDIHELIMERSELQRLLIELLREYRQNSGALAPCAVLLHHPGRAPSTAICIREPAIAEKFEQRLADHVAQNHPAVVDFGDMLTKFSSHSFLLDCKDQAPIETVAIDLTAFA